MTTHCISELTLSCSFRNVNITYIGSATSFDTVKRAGLGPF